MYEAGEGVAPAGVDRLLQLQQSVRMEAGQPTLRRANTDDERDVDTAAPGATYVKSETQR